MQDTSALTGLGAEAAEELFARYRRDPASVAPAWRAVFAALPEQRTLADDEATVEPELDPTDASADAAERVPYLRHVSLFQGLSETDLVHVASLARRVVLPAGERLFATGDPADALFVVGDGALRVERNGKVLGLIREAEVVGEMGLVDGKPRSADVFAHDDAVLLELPAAAFSELVERRRGVGRHLLRVLASRLRHANAQQERVDQLARSYRNRGHAVARLDPLGRRGTADPELSLEYHGLSEDDLDTPFTLQTGAGPRTLPLRAIQRKLENTYCRSIGVQFMHIDDERVRHWLQHRMEDGENRLSLSREEQRRILGKLTDAEVFETFIHRKFVGAKRFSLEGGESLIPLLDMAVEEAAALGVEEMVIGMAHRGRLNVLANVMGKPPAWIFEEFKDRDPDRHLGGGGDVKYHMGFSNDHATASGRSVHLSLCFNPSHLAVVTPVVLGRVRAKQDRAGDEARRRVMGLVIHGDAAFAGQGVVQESLNLSGLPGYRTGGTLHVVVNNQVGFTTDPEFSRSTPYATDIARTLDAPVFHVNGEDPEAVAQVIRLAMAFRTEFARDVCIDMYCYRRHGHNEGDDPTFTQPVMYRWIAQQPPVRQGYLAHLQETGGLSAAEAEEIFVASHRRLEEELQRAEAGDLPPAPHTSDRLWKAYRGGPDADTPEGDTGVALPTLQSLLRAQTVAPSGFQVHPKIQKLFETRTEMAAGRRSLDWGAGEALAFASVLADGLPIRLSGQDAGRGTFTHRHSVLHDHGDGHRHVPLQHLSPGQGRFEVWDSPLSEVGVLAFDWGYSLDRPAGLVIWEAQFGDFANVAQAILDQFVASAEQKWRRLSGLVLLLPHGFEGQGPEHSSARLERFLAMAARDNIQVASPTTPAQLFHLLRRQALRPWRKPLVVMSPKSLLRHPLAVSPLDEFAQGRFWRVIGDPVVDASATRHVLLCSGKVYYDLAKARDERGANDTAVVRLEQLYPLPEAELQSVLDRYPTARLTWVQEEPANMGAWGFLRLNLSPAAIGGRSLAAVARAESASPATGSGASHKAEQALLLDQAFGA
ncbi:MAG: 2-oxoglutarate dehydrogenase E1 component [Vicinamibacteria bacterium]|nr:2-oxoglutarate dehydrogenase E1 component [Vicinamibacteria bacterium]